MLNLIFFPSPLFQGHLSNKEIELISTKMKQIETDVVSTCNDRYWNSKITEIL